MRPLAPPFDAIVAGRPARISQARTELLRTRLLTKELAFTEEERDAFELRGVLPHHILTIEEQVTLEVEHLRRKHDDLERWIGLAQLQDRNATLYYRVLRDNLEELLPVVYTPTVGRACLEYSHLLRRVRGLWITPDLIDRIPQVLRAGPYDDVRLIVATDNERILGLGDLGAGGMGIPVGKLALYSAAAGIHPSLTLPVSLDVGTDNESLLADPLYIGYRAPRLRGAAYADFIDAFVDGVRSVWPGCILQWEDLKGENALAILERHRGRLPSFNDDIEGTAAVVVAAVLGAARATGTPPARTRYLIDGAGAAGVGIARLLRALLCDEGLSPAEAERAVVCMDTHGIVHDRRTDLGAGKRSIAVLADAISPDPIPEGIDLEAAIDLVRPDVLIGATGVAGAFDERAIRRMAEQVARPVILPISNPTENAEATPAQILAWTRGRAWVATGSPFDPVVRDGVTHHVAQANNVLIFPGLGLGLMAAEADGVDAGTFLAAARTLAARTSAERLAMGAILPPLAELPVISREIAIEVARRSIASGHSPLDPGIDPEALVDAATWEPRYVPYLRG